MTKTRPKFYCRDWHQSQYCKSVNVWAFKFLLENIEKMHLFYKICIISSSHHLTAICPLVMYRCGSPSWGSCFHSTETYPLTQRRSWSQWGSGRRWIDRIRPHSCRAGSSRVQFSSSDRLNEVEEFERSLESHRVFYEILKWIMKHFIILWHCPPNSRPFIYDSRIYKIFEENVSNVLK